MTRIERSVEVPGSPDRVFALLTDLERLPEWATIVVDTRDVSDHPLRAGSTFRQTVRVLGQEIDSDWKVVALEHPELVSYEATGAGGARLTMTQRLSAADGDTRVDLEIDYELPGGLIGTAIDRTYFEPHNEREAERSLENLRALLRRERGSAGSDAS